VVCGHTDHIDMNAADNLEGLHDRVPAACVDRKVIKALWDRRHQDWQDKQRLSYGQPPSCLVNGQRFNG